MVVGGYLVKVTLPFLAGLGVTTTLPLIATLSGLGLITYYGLQQSHHTPLFKELRLKSHSGCYPCLIGIKDTGRSKIYRYTIPRGLCMTDFIKNKEAFHDQAGHDVDIRYNYRTLVIEEFYKDMPTKIEYKPVKLPGDVPILIGYNRAGQIVYADISTGEPMVLCAGTPGGGKSTSLRAVTCNLIVTTDPEIVELYLIDLKFGAEFKIFEKSSRVKEFCRRPEEAEILLNSMVEEVERRYKLFFDADVKDIKAYNNKCKPLPYRVIIIDEFALLKGFKECGEAMERLSCMARACGIHLIIATQKPTADIIGKIVKSCFGNIIGFRTENHVDSQTIIDRVGLETLRGNGHGWFRRGGLITEFQAPYLDPEKCEELIKHTYIKKLKPNITPAIDYTQLEVFNEK